MSLRRGCLRTFAIPFQVSPAAGLSLPPNLWPGGLPYRGGGLFNHADAAGAEIFRFTAAFLRGLRSFTSLGLTAHPVRFSSLTTIRRRLGFRPDIGSRRRPFPFSIQPLTRMGFQGAQFSDPIWRLGPHLRITSEPWMVSAAHRNRVVHHPWSFRLTGEGRIPSGCYPSPLPPPFGKDGSYRIALFPGLPGGSRDSLIGDPMKFGFSHSRMFPFQGFPHSPLSLDSLAARVMHRRWHPPPHGGEPLTSASSLSHRRRGLLRRFPIPRFTERRDVPEAAAFKGRPSFVSFEAADL